MVWNNLVRRAGGLSFSMVLVAVLAAGTSQAQAASCDQMIPGGGSPLSVWEFDEDDGEFEEATLFNVGGSDLERDDAFDDYGELLIDTSDYENPNDEGCRLPGTQEVLYPGYELSGLIVKPQLYVAKRKQFGRQYVSLRNPTDTAIEVDVAWDGDLGSDSSTSIGRSSSGDSAVDAGDRWATSCEDGDADGCANTGGEADRDPELAHNWEGKGKKKHSADEVADMEVEGGDVFVEFEDVRVGPGKTIAFMEIVSLATNIKKANKAAAAIDRNGAGYGVFAELSKKERKRVQNW